MVGGPRVGIDFGTSHTVAMCQWQGRPVYPLLFDASPLLPSAVFAVDGRLLVGRDAERSARIDPAAFEPAPKQRIDDGTVLLGTTEYPVADLIAAVLRRCLDEAERVTGEAVEQVVLTHPAGWGQHRQAVLVDAAGRAGVRRVTMVPEPAAAAVYFSQVIGQRVGPDGAVVVYDFGGGTADVAVVRRSEAGWEVAASDGLADVGGVDLDGVLIAGLRAALSDQDQDSWSRLTQPRTTGDRRSRRLLWEDARAAKELLSRNATANVHVPIYDTNVHITRDEFERQARPLLERTIALTVETLRRSGVPRDGVAGLVLVGGSSRIPLVATLLHQRLGIVPTVIEQPELVVAQGSLLAVPPAPAAAPDRSTLLSPGPVATAPISSAPFPATPSSPAPWPGAPHSPAPFGDTPTAPYGGTPTAPFADTSTGPVVDAPTAPLAGAPTAPFASTAAPQEAPRPRQQNGPGRRRRTLVLVGAVTALVVAVAVVVVALRVNRTPKLTAQGRTNAAAFTSVALRAFARRWLNDANRCAPEQTDANSSEKVNCQGDRWAVNFRAYPGAADRNQAREVRRTAYELGDYRDLNGAGAASGIRVTYLQEGQYQVVYWDDEGAPVSGDLYATELTRTDLLRIWNKHVG
jgi:hypothetical protein